jgi:tetratricopeptide (TPR) repeat protein
LLESGQSERALTLISRLRIPMLDSGEHDAIVRLLNGLATALPSRLEPLEWLVDTYGRTSDSFRMPDALANLGDALAAAKQYPRAKEIFEQLVDRQPESESAKRKLNAVLRNMGLPAPEEEPEPEQQETLQAEIAQPEAPKLRPDIVTPEEEKVAAASVVEQPLDEETQKFIAQSLTDVDLFASYGLTQKAIGLLEAILRRAPAHTPTLEKLLDFVLGAGDDRRTAELAAQLERIHRDRGETADAERFGELRRRFQRAAGLSDEEMAAAAAASTAEVASEDSSDSEESLQELPVPVEEAAPVKAAAPPPPPPPPKPAAPAVPVHEVDLSDEWASLLAQGSATDTKESVPAVAPPPPPPLPAAKAPPAAVRQTPAAAAPEEFEIAEFSVPGELPAAAHAPAEIPVSAEDPAFEILSVDDESEGEPLPPRAPQVPATPEAAEEVPEIVLDQEYELVLSPEPEVAGNIEPAKTAKPGPSQVLNTDQFLAELADEIDQLGLDQLSPPVPEPAVKEAAPAVTARAEVSAGPAENEPLKEVFEEFRAELGEMGAEDEDLETHYNLGIAFREMGLVEEAISEFQKVAKAIEKGKPFRYTMQCFTLLGVAFTEKGQPGIAAIWYERALRTPGVDAESTLALRYDLGVAQESANDLDAALKSFSQVYAVNIDYRDVADRIAALQKTTR